MCFARIDFSIINNKNEFQLVTVLAEEVRSCSVGKVIPLKTFINNYLKQAGSNTLPGKTDEKTI